MHPNTPQPSTLELKRYKEDNTYVWVEEWRLVPSSHAPGVYYLVMAAIVKWQDDSLHWAVVTVMQYSNKEGHNVALRMPAHVLPEDFDRVQAAESEMRQVIANIRGRPGSVPGHQPVN